MPAILSLENVFYAVWIILAAAGLYLAIELYRKKIMWPRARRMGIPMAIFAWMNVIYGTVLFDGAYGVVSVIFDLPLWVDIVLLVVIFGMIMGVYFKLVRKEKFNSVAFVALFLIPLSIPGTHTAAKLIPAVGKMMPAVVKLVPQTVPVFQTAKRLTRKDTPETPKPRPENPGRFPQKIQIGRYIVEFLDTVSKGTFGDWLTTTRLTAKDYGYTKLHSKIDGLHGIDGVYVRFDNEGSLQKILIVENKVDGGRLTPGQMTDEWIAERVDKMIRHVDNAKVRHTGQLIRSNPGLIHKELWHHDLSSGQTTINVLDAMARKTSEERVERFLINQVRKRCESAKTTLICLPAAA